MSDNPNIPDQDDILATNEQLRAENGRLTGELKAATELLETAQDDLSTATARAAQLAERVTVLETASKVAGEELTRLNAENAGLTARLSDFNKAVAAEVAKLGLNANAAPHKEAPSDTDLTPTQRVLAARVHQQVVPFHAGVEIESIVEDLVLHALIPAPEEVGQAPGGRNVVSSESMVTSVANGNIGGQRSFRAAACGGGSEIAPPGGRPGRRGQA